MKSSLLLSVLASLTLISSAWCDETAMSTASITQSEPSSIAQNLKFDVHVGPTYSLMSGVDLPDSHQYSRPHVGVTMGLGMDIPMNSTLTIRTELNYSQKGVSTESWNEWASGMIYSDFTGNYLEIPFLLKAGFTLGPVHPYFTAGSSVAFLVSKSLRIQNESESPSLTNSDADNVNSLDYGLRVGGGIEIPLNSRNALIIDARYDHGLAEVNTTPRPRDDEPSIHNRSFTVATGLSF